MQILLGGAYIANGKLHQSVNRKWDSSFSLLLFFFIFSRVRRILRGISRSRASRSHVGADRSGRHVIWDELLPALPASHHFVRRHRLHIDEILNESKKENDSLRAQREIEEFHFSFSIFFSLHRAPPGRHAHLNNPKVIRCRKWKQTWNATWIYQTPNVGSSHWKVITLHDLNVHRSLRFGLEIFVLLKTGTVKRATIRRSIDKSMNVTTRHDARTSGAHFFENKTKTR